MVKHQETIPAINHLRFKKGELIVTEGDYGISIYNIIKGTVLSVQE